MSLIALLLALVVLVLVVFDLRRVIKKVARERVKLRRVKQKHHF